jgi:hypothetical protein
MHKEEANRSQLPIRGGAQARPEGFRIERLRLRKALTDEYKLQRSEERKAIASQIRDDHEVGHKRM